MKIFNLPDLGEGLVEAEINQWHVQVGDVVQADDVLVSVETAKALVDVPSPYSGKIIKLYGDIGDIIKTGKPLVEFASNEANDKGTVAGNIEVGEQILIEDPLGINTNAAASPTIKAIPAVRALAKKLQVDLTKIKPSGANQHITLADVAAASKTTPGATEHYQPLHGLRRAMAQTMEQAYAQIVPVTLVDDAVLSNNEESSDITVMIIKALIHACQAEPALNAWYDASTISRQVHSQINLGLALDTADGLLVPVIKNAAQLSNAALRATINTFKQQAVKRSFAADELRHATIMLSNFGNIAGRYATPMIVPPCVAILGVGQLREQAVVSHGQIDIQKTLPLSLTIDHRAVTGSEAARFLANIINYFKNN